MAREERRRSGKAVELSVLGRLDQTVEKLAGALGALRWVLVVLLVISIGLGIGMTVVSGRIDDIRDQVEALDEAAEDSRDAARRAEAASIKASEDLADALRRSREQGVSSDEVREVFATIFRIRDLVCLADDPKIREACDG